MWHDSIAWDNLRKDSELLFCRLFLFAVLIVKIKFLKGIWELIQIYLKQLTTKNRFESWKTIWFQLKKKFKFLKFCFYISIYTSDIFKSCIIDLLEAAI